MLDEHEPELTTAHPDSMATAHEAPPAEESHADGEPEETTTKKIKLCDTPEERVDGEARDGREETADAESSQRLDPETLLRRIDQGFERLSQAFEDKLAYDQHKERQIEALHSELQEHKRGLLGKAIRPLISSLVRLHDNLGRVAIELRDRQEDALSHLEAAQILEEFQDDVEIVLEDNGIRLFQEPTEHFEPRRQTASQTIETPDSELVGLILRRLRPGFERDEQVLQKERVAVYVAERRSAAVAESTTEPTAEPGC